MKDRLGPLSYDFPDVKRASLYGEVFGTLERCLDWWHNSWHWVKNPPHTDAFSLSYTKISNLLMFLYQPFHDALPSVESLSAGHIVSPFSFGFSKEGGILPLQKIAQSLFRLEKYCQHLHLPDTICQGDFGESRGKDTCQQQLQRPEGSVFSKLQKELWKLQPSFISASEEHICLWSRKDSWQVVSGKRRDWQSRFLWDCQWQGLAVLLLTVSTGVFRKYVIVPSGHLVWQTFKVQDFSAVEKQGLLDAGNPAQRILDPLPKILAQILRATDSFRIRSSLPSVLSLLHLLLKAVSTSSLMQNETDERAEESYSRCTLYA